MGVVVVLVCGGLGTLLRGGLSRLNRSWPHGTIVVNLLGSFALGVLVTATDDPLILTGIGSGLLGGMTTFSTFAVEGVTRPSRLGGAYVIASVIAGVGCAALGLGVGARLGV